MKQIILSAVLSALVAGPLAVAPAAAQGYDRDYRWHGDRRDWDARRDYRDDRRYYGRERRLSRNDRIYRGGDGR